MTNKHEGKPAKNQLKKQVCAICQPMRCWHKHNFPRNYLFMSPGSKNVHIPPKGKKIKMYLTLSEKQKSRSNKNATGVASFLVLPRFFGVPLSKSVKGMWVILRLCLLIAGLAQFRKGMILADAKLACTLEACWQFHADVTVLFASGRIQNNFQPVFHGRCFVLFVHLMHLRGRLTPHERKTKESWLGHFFSSFHVQRHRAPIFWFLGGFHHQDILG